jgi:hypothetical protein
LCDVVPDGAPKVATHPKVVDVLWASDYWDARAAWDKLKSGPPVFTTAAGLYICPERLNLAESKKETVAGFRDRVLKQLGLLMHKSNGRRLVMSLIQGTESVTIVPSNQDTAAQPSTAPGTQPTTPEDAKEQDDERRAAEYKATASTPEGYVQTTQTGPHEYSLQRGQGSGAKIEVDPDLQNFSVKGLSTPAFVALAHELIHASHFEEGDDLDQPLVTNNMSPAQQNRWTNAEEYLTISGGEGVTENDVRAENNLPARQSHTDNGG